MNEQEPIKYLGALHEQWCEADDAWQAALEEHFGTKEACRRRHEGFDDYPQHITDLRNRFLAAGELYAMERAKVFG